MLPFDPNRGGLLGPAGDPLTGAPAAPRLLPFTKAGPLGMLLLLGVVVLAVFLLGSVGGKPKEQQGTITTPDEMVKEPKLEFLSDGDLAEQYPSTVRDELQQELTTWFQQPGRAQIDDRADFIEPEWMSHLHGDDVRPRLERLPAWVFGEIGDTSRLVEEPGPHRGRMVQVWGATRSVEEIELPATPAVRGWRLVLDDADGRSWSVLTPRAPPPGVLPGSWARAFGVFVKLRPSAEGKPSFVLLAEHSVLASFPPVAEKAISTEWAEQVADDTMEKSRVRPGEEEAFWRLMNYVRTMGPEGYRAKVASGELKVVDRTGSAGTTELAAKPALHRFELVRLRVGVAQGEGAFVTEQDLLENAGNIRQVFRGFVIDDQQRVIWVMTPFSSDTFRIAGARLATIEGFFYKRMAVEAKGGKLYWMPVIVATAIEAVDLSKPPSNAATIAAWCAIVGAIGCTVLWIVLTIRSRREAAESQKRHLERVAKRAAEKQTAGGV